MKAKAIVPFLILAVLSLIFHFSCGDGTSGPPPRIYKSSVYIHSGNYQSINPGERLGCNWAYKPIIQVLDSNGLPMRGVGVFHEVLDGNESFFTFGPQCATSVLRIQNRPGYEWDTLIGDYLHIDSIDPNIPLGTYRIRLFSSRPDITGGDTLFINIEDDLDSSTIDPINKPHELQLCGYNPVWEVPGDGFSDGHMCFSTDTNNCDYYTHEKELHIEFDYSEDFKNAPYNVNSIITYITQILETAGMRVRVYTNAEEKLDSRTFRYENDFRDALFETRDFFLYDHLHVILTTGWTEGDLNGIAGQCVEYSDTISARKSGPFKCREMAKYQNYLDRCGCVIMGEKIRYEWQELDDSIRIEHWHSVNHVLAYACAHEIGHALGIVIHDDTLGVMKAVRDFGNTGYWYDSLCFFRPKNILYGIDTFPNYKSAINLRDIIGIQTVDFGS